MSNLAWRWCLYEDVPVSTVCSPSPWLWLGAFTKKKAVSSVSSRTLFHQSEYPEIAKASKERQLYPQPHGRKVRWRRQIYYHIHGDVIHGEAAQWVRALTMQTWRLKFKSQYPCLKYAWCGQVPATLALWEGGTGGPLGLCGHHPSSTVNERHYLKEMDRAECSKLKGKRKTHGRTSNLPLHGLKWSA